LDIGRPSVQVRNALLFSSLAITCARIFENLNFADQKNQDLTANSATSQELLRVALDTTCPNLGKERKEMKWSRVIILLMMGVIVFCMVSCPGFNDSRRVAVALRHYTDSPTSAAQKEVQDAKAAANGNILIMESFLAIVVISMGFLFYKMGKTQIKTLPAICEGG
jgi:hypothetical protein